MEEQKETEITSDGVTDSDVEKEKPVPESGESEVTEEKVSNSEVVTHSSIENGDESPAEMVNISEAERNNESSEDFEFANGINGSDEESWETVSDEAEEAGSAVHQNEGPCDCPQCVSVFMTHSARLMERSTHDIEEIPETVTKLETEDGCKLYLVGTAHFSEASQEEVAKTIQTVCPDVVMVELCKSRVSIIQYDEETLLREAKDINFSKLKMAVKESGVIGGVMQLLLLSMSAHLTKQLGMAPGGEFRRAVSEAKKIPGCQIMLADRPIQVTLSRAMAALNVWQKMKLAWYLITSRDPISKEDVEKYKQKDMLAELLAEMTGDFPTLTQVFVSERDKFMAQALRNAATPIPVADETGELKGYEASVVVAVVGLGHVPGITENFGKDIDIQELLKTPEKRNEKVLDPKKNLNTLTIKLARECGLAKNLVIINASVRLTFKMPKPSNTSRIFKYTLRAVLVAALSWGVYKMIRWTGIIPSISL